MALFAKGASVFVGIILAGTGGAQQLGEIGYTPANMRVVSTPRRGSNCSRDLPSIRGVFGLTMTGLAKAFGVSRQTVYNWSDGGPPNSVHQAKLVFLASVSRELQRRGAKSKISLEQAMSFGGTLLQLADTNVDPIAVADELVALTNGKSVRRAQIAERLAAKRARGIHVDLADTELG
jgi:hypothetical protein